MDIPAGGYPSLDVILSGTITSPWMAVSEFYAYNPNYKFQKLYDKYFTLSHFKHTRILKGKLRLNKSVRYTEATTGFPADINDGCIMAYLFSNCATIGDGNNVHHIAHWRVSYTPWQLIQMLIYK